MKRLFLISIIFLIPAVASAQAKDAEILLRLNHLHETPSMAELETLSPTARQIVEHTARKTHGIGQIRAIHVLASTRDRDAFTTLSSLLSDSSTPEMTRHELIRALIRHFGDSALPLASTWLRDEDLQRRLTIIEALGELDSETSLTLLEGRLVHANSRVERDALQRAMRHVR